MRRSQGRISEPSLPLVSFLLAAGVLSILVLAGFFKEEVREWEGYQVAFRDLEIARANTTEQREAAQSLPVRLRQIFIPELQTVDRCISCHLGVDDPSFAGAEQPFSYHPDHDVHPFERFGCTVCHGGQGRATTVEDAHGEVPFWDAPMIDVDYIEASCGGCHDPNDNPSAPELALGAHLFEEAGCRGCHRLDGWGGPSGPDLDRHLNDQLRSPDWLMQHFLDPAALVPGSAMPKYGFSEQEAKALTLFMLSRLRTEVSGYHASRRILESAERGAKLFQAKGCLGCHAVGGTGADTGPPLDDVVTRRNQDWLIAHFKDPQSVSPGTVMPEFGFSEAEAQSLVLFLRRLHEVGPETVRASIDFTTEQRGERLFKRYGCRGCHGLNGEGGVANRNSQTGEFVPALTYVKEGYTWEELRKQIRKGVPVIEKLDPLGPVPPLSMPAFESRLTDQQIDDVVAFLVSLYPEGEELDW